jgi:hypothetical protein
VKGILRSALIFYSAGKLQRALLGVSLLVMVGGPLILTISPPSHEHMPAFLDFELGLPLTMSLAGTLLIGAVTFRATSALHTLWFIPYARLRLAISVLLAEVILTTLVTIYVALLHRATPMAPLSWGSLTGTFIGTLAIMTLLVLWVFFLLSATPWVRWMSVILGFVGALLALQRRWSVSEVTGISAADFLALVAIIASSLFTVWYLRARRISVLPGDAWSSGLVLDAKASDTIAATRRSVINLYILGQSSVLRACLGALGPPLFFNTFTLFMFWSKGVPRPDLAGALLPLMILLIGLAGSQFGSDFAQRSRTLWIRSGYTRRELFEMAERLSLRCLAFTAAPLLALSAVEWILLVPKAFDWRFPLLVASSTAICGVYVGLTNVKREWWNYPALVVFCLVSCSTATPDSPFFLDARNSSLPFMIPMAQVVAALALRSIAQRRWQRLDWLVASRHGFRLKGCGP